MHIIRILSDLLGRKTVFVLSNFKVLTLPEMISGAAKGLFPGWHLVNTNSWTYVRSNPNKIRGDNLASLSQPLPVLAQSKSPGDQAILKAIVQRKKRDDQKKDKTSEGVRAIDWRRRKSEAEIYRYLKRFKAVIRQAAKQSKVDPHLLGAVLIDEYVRLDFWDLFDWRAALPLPGPPASVGIAQIKIETARSSAGYIQWLRNSHILVYEYNDDRDDPIKVFAANVETGKMILLGGRF